MTVPASLGGEVNVPAPVPGEVRSRTPRQEVWRRFRADRVAMSGLVLVAALFILGFGAPLIAKIIGHGPNTIFGSSLNAFGLPSGPSVRFLFGTDSVGRDVFLRTIYGTRTSLVVALAASIIATIIGVIAGTLAGYFGGWVDTLIARTIDAFLSLPVLLFAMGVSSACSISAAGCLGGTFRPGTGLIVAIMAIFTWPYIGRIVRGQVLQLRDREFVRAARGLGAGHLWIMGHELLPNLAMPIIVFLSLIIPGNVLFEAALSYFGIGIPQSTPSLGQMISESATGDLFTYAWWTMLFPGLFLLLITLAFNLVGDGLRDAMDPRSR